MTRLVSASSIRSSLAVFVTVDASASQATGHPAGSPEALTHGIAVAFATGAIFAALAILVSLLIVRPPRGTGV